jgi:alcohol dehydrogenase class IV
LLRASSAKECIEVDIEAVIDAGADSNIEHGRVLTAFAEAIVGRNAGDIAAKRQALIDAAGKPAMVDAAGVASNFQRMVRIADGIGIPLGKGLEEWSAKTREQLGLNRWQTH